MVEQNQRQSVCPCRRSCAASLKAADEGRARLCMATLAPKYERAASMTTSAPSHLPVLSIWHDQGGRRPAGCGVVGCTATMVPGQPSHPCDCSGAGCKAGRWRLVVKEYHLKHRLCPAHCMCPAVLRQGVPQRWCAQCNAFHELNAFHGGNG